MKREAEMYLGLAVVAAIVVYFVGKKLAAAGSAATNAVSSGLANAYVSLTSGPGIQAQGGITMPDGSFLPASVVTMTFNTQANAGEFTYQGQQYLTQSRDANGNWIAYSASMSPTAYDPSSVSPDTLSLAGTGSPAVLPYSYKQSVVDTPSILGTDALLTPSYDGGSSGAYLN